MLYKNKHILFAVAALVFLGCSNQVDYYNLPLYSKQNFVQAVIEIPAGTNKKYEYNKETFQFEIDQKNGKDRIINFLPYVGNYGFIPSTYSNPKLGGDGDALDVLVLSESQPTGTVLEITPIAMLKLIDEGDIDYKIIAVNSNVNSQIISSKTLTDFTLNYPEVKSIIELWFLNYNKDDDAKIEGWADEKEAVAEIFKNQI